MPADKKPLRLISFHSFKGGVGKSTLAVLFALALQRKSKVCLLDLDLLAPGLHHLLRLPPPKRSIFDYLLGDPDPDRQPPTPGDLVVKAKPVFPGQRARISIVPATADFEQSRGLLGYLLADLRAGLLQARLEILLEELREEHHFDLFLLDTPPSLFATSAMVRGLVERHRGVLVHVSCANVQDLTGTRAMLEAVNHERNRALEKNPNAAAATREVFVLNRYDRSRIEGDPLKQIVNEVLHALEKKQRSRREREAVRSWLERYDLAVIEERSSLMRMSRTRRDNEPLPTKRELLDDTIEDLALRTWRFLREGARA